jgi:hypothetical protein
MVRDSFEQSGAAIPKICPLLDKSTVAAEPEIRDSVAMAQDLARVPALVLCGGSTGDRASAIARLAGPVAGGHPVAVLRAGTGLFGGPGAQFGPHVVVKRAPIGCLCCTAGVVFRVTLFGLLHATRPARLVVDLGVGEHVPAFEAELRSESLSRVLSLVGRVDLDEAKVAEPAWP